MTLELCEPQLNALRFGGQKHDVDVAVARSPGQVAAAEIQGFEANAEHYLIVKASRSPRCFRWFRWWMNFMGETPSGYRCLDHIFYTIFYTIINY